MNIKNKHTDLFIISILFMLIFIPSIIYVYYMDAQVTTEPTVDSTLKIMTYNLHYGIGMDGKFDPARIAAFVASKDIDIVGFEELSHDFILNTGGDFASLLEHDMKQYGYKYHVFSDYYNGGLFNAIFSKYPILESQKYKIEPVIVLQRTLVKATIDINGKHVDVYDTHLSHIYEDKSNPDRVEQVKYILNIINKSTNPVIFMGDFNAFPDWPEIMTITNAGYTDAFATTNPGNNTASWPSTDPTLHIDYIFLKQVTPVNAYILKTLISDHLPLMSIITL